MSKRILFNIHPKYFDLIKNSEIKVFARCVDWYHLSFYKGEKLEESFIEKYIDSFQYYMAFIYLAQDNLSDEFFIKYWDLAKRCIRYKLLSPLDAEKLQNLRKRAERFGLAT